MAILRTGSHRQAHPPDLNEPTIDAATNALTTASASNRDDDPDASLVVSKATEAVALRPKRGRLTLLSRRIYNVLLMHAQRQGVTQQRYSILLSDLIDDARFNSNNTELLKAHLRDMQVTTIEWHTSSGQRQTWQSTQLIGDVLIDSPGRGRPCTIQWTFPEPIRDKLIQPAHYARFLLAISNEMRSFAAATLYELGAQYLTSPAGLTMREDLVWWASVLTGRSDITQVDYRTFHRDTIKKALAELRALCPDFTMEVIEHKRGRRVEELQFRVIAKPQRPLSGLEPGGRNTFDLELVDRLVQLGLKRADAQDLYAETDEGALRAALAHVEQRLRSATLAQLKSPVAYLRDALRKNYAGHAASVPAVEAAPVAASPGEKLARLREEWKSARMEQAKAHFSEMALDAQTRLIERFEAERLDDLPSPIVRAWQRDRVASRVASSSFFRFVAEVLWPGEVSDTDLLAFAVERL